jgi:hypothetical protein
VVTVTLFFGNEKKDRVKMHGTRIYWLFAAMAMIYAESCRKGEGVCRLKGAFAQKNPETSPLITLMTLIYTDQKSSMEQVPFEILLHGS